MDDKAVDAVVVCSSTDSHSEIVIDAAAVGKHVFCEKPPGKNVDDIKETFNLDIHEILKETLEHEKKAISMYYELLSTIGDKSVYLEEYARTMIGQEELHVLEVEKMLKDN